MRLICLAASTSSFIRQVCSQVDIDQFETSVDAHVIAVNLVGAMAWCNPSGPQDEGGGDRCDRRHWSVAGERGRMGNPAHCASKAGLPLILSPCAIGLIATAFGSSPSSRVLSARTWSRGRGHSRS